MRIILGIETTTERLSAALIADGIIHERHTDSRSAHCELLAEFIHELTKAAALDLDDIDAVAVSIGPGSFTGIRIGIATAMGLSYALGVPAVGIDTLMALAWCAETPGLVCPIIDARRREVYAGVYRVDGPRIELPAVIREPLALSPAALAALLDEIGEPVTLAGPAADTFGEAIAAAVIAAPISIVTPPRGKPSAAAIAELGLRIAEAGETIPTHALTPRYLRRADAVEARRTC